MSYYGEKAFTPDDLTPLPIADPVKNKFARQTCHRFTVLEKPVDPMFLEDRKALYKNIIKGKRRVSELSKVLKAHNKL